MKNIVYLAIIAVMMMIADTASAQWTDIFGNPGGNSGKAELTTNKASTIKWETLEQNLGDVKQKVPTLVEFTFTNTGKKPLLLYNVTAACNCTKVEYSTAPVMPGKTGTIKVIFKADKPDEVGARTKRITVDSNAKTDRVILTLKANVVMN